MARPEAEQEKQEERKKDMEAQDRIIDIAKVCHEANKALCETQDDNSQPAWEEAPAWQRNSALDGVRFHREHPEMPASASHVNWLALKEKEGWVYGPVKDPEKKEHPCMVRFEELPKHQQAKDHLFKAIVEALLNV